MEGDPINLLLVGLIIAVFSLWWQNLGVKQIALHAAQRHCDEMGVQLLDETIILQHFKLKRERYGPMRMWRSFSFEFSTTGDTRYHGRVDILGTQITNVQLDPHRISTTYSK